MKGCRNIREKFDERLDGRLEEAAQISFDAHVAACAECGREWESYSNLWSALGRAPAMEPSFGFAERTVRRLHEKTKPVVWRLPIVRWVSATGLCALLSLAVWMRCEHSRRTGYAQAYVAAQQDRLEDFDVVASLHELNGDSRL